MFDYYRIENGDSLESIADKFKVSVEDLKSANRMYINELRVGMDILVPKNKEQYFNYYTIESGDSLYKIAQKYNINPTLLANLNGLDMDAYIYPNQEILIPKSGYSYYITAEGDTLDTVANVFKKAKDEVIDDNPTIYLMENQILVTKR